MPNGRQSSNWLGQHAWNLVLQIGQVMIRTVDSQALGRTHLWSTKVPKTGFLVQLNHLIAN